ncbi:hypothetical protein MMC06_004244 [Schaereria dolodes]|nr:hypothetical protein [Schaereria dolodes]
MGCSLSALIASKGSSLQQMVKFDILGLIAICPKASTPSEQQLASFRKLLSVPTTLFELWRRWDRRCGPYSASVSRFVGADADLETRKIQEKFNLQSQTSVWRRMAWGALPTLRKDGTRSGGMPGPALWADISTSLYLIAGGSDTITKAEEVAVISNALEKSEKPRENLKSNPIPEIVPLAMNESSSSIAHSISDDEARRLGVSGEKASLTTNGDSYKSRKADLEPVSSRRRQVLRTSILPSPASHALLYDHATYRTLAGLIQTFLADHVDSRLSLGWQLQHLCTEGKWDVKNLAKWQAVKPVSEPIGHVFRALKTLREIDNIHRPSIFVTHWRSEIKAVIDISHESPVYDPKGLEAGGIQYYKFPTVSKIPPTSEEVKEFVGLVDRLRSKSDDRLDPPVDDDKDRRLLGVHCHYGFNRTGFFICSYLIEVEGYTVQRAIDEFQRQRPPGIRHEHFIDTLFVRYCIGLKRAPTV